MNVSEKTVDDPIYVERDPHKAVDYMVKNAEIFAQAKAQRIYLEEFRKSLKATLMKGSLEDTIGAQEREAYAHQDYKNLLLGLREAVEIEERLRWKLVAAQTRVEVWRSEQANLRAEGKATI
jgi:uncharacterized protein YnzC (UPF0291/DUF896 family)